MVNIKPANRINKVEEYYFSRKLKEIREMNKSGKEVINLGIGSPDLSPSPEVMEELKVEAQNPGNHAYQPYNGIPELREAFAGWYKKNYNVDLNPDSEILPLMGSKEGIMHISMAFLNPGDVALVPNPGYPAYRSASQIAGASVHEFKLLEEKKWMPDIESLERNLPRNAKLMWINYPNMPTGGRGIKEEFAKLIDFATKHNILLINDNPYSFILNDNPESLLSIEGAKDVMIELNSLSKSHNMAGWRIGMAGGKSGYISYILRVKSNMDSGMFKPVQLAAVKALKADESWYSKQNAIYRERRELIQEIFDMLGCSYDTDQTGMFVWARIPEEAESGQMMADQILDRSRVFITPGFIFGSAGDRFLRASLCQPVDVIKEAFARLM